MHHHVDAAARGSDLGIKVDTDEAQYRHGDALIGLLGKPVGKVVADGREEALERSDESLDITSFHGAMAGKSPTAGLALERLRVRLGEPG